MMKMVYVIIGVVFLTGIVYCLLKIGKQADSAHRRLMIAGQQEVYQASEERPVLLVIENGKEDVFADYTAIYGYPNYLFRSDTKQQWTTGEVSNNFCIWAENMEVEFFTDDSEHRKNMVRHLMTMFEELATGGNITSRAFYKRMCFFNMWFVNRDLKEVHLNMDIEAQALIMAVLRKLQCCEQIVPLCAVIHMDEGVSHVHFLYCKKKEYKKVPSVREILNDGVGKM